MDNYKYFSAEEMSYLLGKLMQKFGPLAELEELTKILRRNQGIIVSGKNEISFGKFNSTGNNEIFSIGVGTDDDHRKNALAVREDGTILVGDSIISEPLVITTAENLETLAIGHKLIPGTIYYVENFITSTSQSGTKSLESPLNLILRAATDSSIFEDGIGIYGQEILDIKYSLNLDDRYLWSSNGVIYWMKDKNGNEAPYDFKNIQFSDSMGGWHYTFDVGIYKDCKIKSSHLFYNLPSTYLYSSQSSDTIYGVSVDSGVRGKGVNVTVLSGNSYEVRVSLRSDSSVVMYCEADLIDNTI